MDSRAVEEKILNAAFRVVDRHTISGTRMHLIAEEAKMVQSNLHYYFKTKQDLMLALLRYLQQNFSESRQAVLDKAPGTLEGQITGFFRQKKDIITQTPEYDRVQYDFWNLGQVDEEVNQCFFESYDIWRKHIAGVIKMYAPELPDERVWLATCVKVSMMMGASLQYLNAPGLFDLDAYFEACLKMMMGYIED